MRNGDRENLPLDLNGPMRGGALDAESGDGGERPDDHNHQIAAPTSTSSAAQRVSLPDSPTDETLIGQNGEMSSREKITLSINISRQQLMAMYANLDRTKYIK